MSARAVRRERPVVRQAAQPVAQPQVEPNRLLWRMVVFGVVLIPLFVFPAGKDLFRTPKDALFRAVGIAVIAVAVYEILIGTLKIRISELRREPAFIVSALIAGWSVITALAATNREYSVESLVTVLAAIAMFAAVATAAPWHRFETILAVIIPAALNGILVILQEFRLWNPFVLDLGRNPNLHLATTGLMGNPNDAGTLLAIAALVAAAAAFSAPFSQRAGWTVTAVLLGGAVMVSQTITAIAALIAALCVLIVVVKGRKGVFALAPLAIVLIAVVVAYAPLRARATSLFRAAGQGHYDVLLTRRLGAFLAAAEMARDHPIVGVGPGCFGFHYFDYKLRVDEKYPDLVFRPASAADWTYNFAEVHNDHLEVIAEGGVPAYLLFLGALGVLAAGSFRRYDVTQTLTGRRQARRAFARALSLPLAALIFVLGIGQFPLQLAATTIVLLFLAGLTYSWSRHEAA